MNRNSPRVLRAMDADPRLRGLIRSGDDRRIARLVRMHPHPHRHRRSPRQLLTDYDIFRAACDRFMNASPDPADTTGSTPAPAPTCLPHASHQTPTEQPTEQPTNTTQQ